MYHTHKATGECTSILSALWNTNNNLMQLLSSAFDYPREVAEYNRSFGEQEINKLTYSIVENLYVSPAIRRGIWQTLSIVEEIRKITGHDPKKVFVEMAREEQEKKRTKSRKQQLIELYKSCDDDICDWLGELENKEEHEFRSDRLYLYYTQMGRCMYTGEEISIENLFNKNLYDIDHIYPQSKVMDDSLENRVLVKREVNAGKSDELIGCDIQKKMGGFWSMLYHKGLIGKKKYERLMRTAPFTPEEFSDFVARQMVEMRQSSKAVAEILKNYFKESEIVYVKAGNVSDFRRTYKLTKVREINDYHHAKDAFLNIVVGNVYNTKFTHDPISFIKKGGYRAYNLKKMYENDVERNGIMAWKAGDGGTIKIVKQTMAKDDILFTRQAREEKGGLFDQMIVKKGSGQVPVKSDVRLDNPERYGMYNKVSGAYFMLVEHTVKGNRIRTLEFVPVYLADKLTDFEQARLDYCEQELGLIAPDIRVYKIRIDSLFCVDGFYMHISGRTGNRLIFKNANQLRLNTSDTEYCKKICKFIERSKQKRGGAALKINTWDEITAEQNGIFYERLVKKLRNTVYSVKLLIQAESLANKQKQFAALSIEEQTKLLYELLHFFQCNSVSSDLSLLRGAKQAGILVLSKVISNQASAKLIHQSPTGIFEKEIDLLTI
ncbi:MAG: type II CRISPR RNA-guided endonuclease Cas9 [Lachnospiraceae bacterium]|nr:type II CRISPR RNA-guided endonuclease Cas9 [Lachnospiraceae bacterium]